MRAVWTTSVPAPFPPKHVSSLWDAEQPKVLTALVVSARWLKPRHAGAELATASAEVVPAESNP
jgi:hypothetical protein